MCSAAPKGQKGYEGLSELEQRLFYTRVLCSNLNFLYQNLNTPAILQQLIDKELIGSHLVREVKQYSNKHAQNLVTVFALQHVTAPPNCLEKLCDILKTTPQQEHIADKLLGGNNAHLLYSWNVLHCCLDSTYVPFL